jgi:hypothetical protein
MPQMMQIAQIQQRSGGRPKAGLETEEGVLKKFIPGDQAGLIFQDSLFGQRRFAPPANAAVLRRGRHSRTGIKSASSAESADRFSNQVRQQLLSRD